MRDPWEQIWRSELFRSFREREDDPVWAGLPTKCHHCPDLPLCGGGCRIEREARDGVRIIAGEDDAMCAVDGHGRAHSDKRLVGFIPLNVIS